MAVGIGDWLDKYELYTIATHPYQTNVILIPKYDDLSTISQRLEDSICNSKYDFFIFIISYTPVM